MKTVFLVLFLAVCVFLILINILLIFSMAASAGEADRKMEQIWQEKAKKEEEKGVK